MDKSNKLRRYSRKSYGQVVDFPVEIIGRDGVVRRYSFEESVRLYQRRLASADVRYNDAEVVRAEKDHCLHRIEQLRRSFFARFGWPAIAVVDSEGEMRGILAGEVAAFLRRTLATIDPEPEAFSFSKLEAVSDCDVYFVKPPQRSTETPSTAHFLLYMYRFEHAGQCAAREAFFEFIKVLETLRAGAAAGIETLVAYHHTVDCGLVLTGSGPFQGDDPPGPEEALEELSWGPDSERQADPFDIGMALLRRGLLKEALERFAAAYSEQHYRRVAYLGAAIVGDQIGDDDEVATATVMGLRYFPGDSALVYHAAVNQVRAGGFSEALELLEQVPEWRVGEAAARVLSAICLLAGFDVRAGRAGLRAVDVDALRREPHMERAHKWVLRQLRARDFLMASASLGCLVGAALAISGELAGLGFAVFCLLALRAVNLSWHRQLIRFLTAAGPSRLQLASAEMLLGRLEEDVLQ